MSAINRKKTRKIYVGNVAVGGGEPISVQSMTKTDTRNVQATVEQIRYLESVGCEIIRLAVPDLDAARALGLIKKNVTIPIIADIHFDWRLALEDLHFQNIKVSLKASNVTKTVEAYRLFSGKYDYPLHVGISEAGPPFSGIIKSAVGVGILLAEGIGDTVRISLTAESAEEIRVAYEILKSLGLRRRGPEIISCPTCGRCCIDLKPLARKVEDALKDIKEPIIVAVMGCVVNGPGEAREADFGIAGGK